MLRLICAICLAAGPLVASSQQMIYKIQMPDGTVLYSDSVPSGGKVLEEREAKSTPRVTTLPSQPANRGGTPAIVTRPSGSSAAGTRSAAPAKSGSVSIEAAERELADARRKLELGREPCRESAWASRAAAADSRPNTKRALPAWNAKLRTRKPR